MVKSKKKKEHWIHITVLPDHFDLRVPYGLKFQVGMDAFCLTAAVGHIEGMRRFLEAGKSPNDACAAVSTRDLIILVTITKRLNIHVFGNPRSV